jgi:hypothetical protein
MAGEELGTCVSHSTHVFLGLGTAVLSRHHVRLPILILELLHTLSHRQVPSQKQHFQPSTTLSPDITALLA